MLSGLHGTEENLSEKKQDRICVNIEPDDCRSGNRDPSPVDIECSSHPGSCVLNNEGVCTKRENAVRLADAPLESLEKTTPERKDRQVAGKKTCGPSCNKKVHRYKIDLNNSQDTGLIEDKQCQTCGPECSPATCSSRTRQFFITWDKVRTKFFLFLVFIFVLWLSVYSALSLTSSL